MEKWRKNSIVTVSLSALFFLTALYLNITFGIIDILGMTPFVTVVLCFCGILSLVLAYLSWRYRKWYDTDDENDFLGALDSDSKTK
ncbi:MAG: hypothetical protein ACFFFK_02050 [Candidatus Thorarchaeota archaeon]